MMKRPHIVAFSALALTIPTFPSLGDEAAPPRTPWKAADPNSGNVVRWVVEGCAAYPVTEDAVPERSVANVASRTAVDPTARPKPAISSN